MKLAGFLALCALGAVSGAETKSTTNNRHERSSATDLFLSIVGERPSGDKNIKSLILPVQLPIQLGGHGGVTLPVLVVPVPVYINNPESCSANNHATSAAEQAQILPNLPTVSNRHQFAKTLNSLLGVQPQEPSQNQLETHSNQKEVQTSQQLENTNANEELNHINQQHENAITHQEIININEQLQATKTPRPYQPVKTYPHQVITGSTPVVHRVNFKVEQDPQVQEPVSYEQAEIEEKIPFSDRSPIYETSEQIIQSFRSQYNPLAPKQAVVIPGLDLPDRLPAPIPSASYDLPSISAAPPPRPDFNRSLRLRVDLTVPSSGYTEAYDIQWHSESNTAKTVVEDGSTILYRAPLANGGIQFLQIQREPTDGQVLRRCTLSPIMQPSPADRAFPGLPAFDQFEFIGYTAAEGRSLVERWGHVVKSGPGEGGAAEGESLTFTHEMFIMRERGLAVPLRYRVVTDSSVLGPNSDTYIHRYSLLTPPTEAVLPDTSKDCDTLEEFADHEVDHDHSHENVQQKRDIGSLLTRVISKFDPLREFAGPTRDGRYDSILTKYKKQFKRKYLDAAEEAVRKNLFIKSSRFIEAGNRLSSGFKMAANFMADRLDDEITQLFGVEKLPEGSSELGLVPFPYSDYEVNNVKLDDEFDWRPIGAVSPVRFQETVCSSCWAFAVAGSTEGALFKKTGKLVPLSPQCLVDCGKPFGTNGCNGTWPSFAYDYVQARGLPAWDEYTNYQAKVLECKDKSVPPVTHIGGHVNVTANSEVALKVAIKNHAPTVVIVDAKAQSFIYYKSGVLKDRRCGQNKPRLNHAVLAVGWGSKDGSHFIIKNTWSEKWGEGGFIRIAPDSCAVLDRPSYSLIEEPNIDREELRAAAARLKA